MRTRLVQIVSLLAAVVLTGCSGITAYVDYDEQAQFETYRTYAWVTPNEPSLADTSPLMHQRVTDGIQRRLDRKLRRVEQDPDLFVTYHTDEKEEVRIDTVDHGYIYGPRWHMNPYWTGRGMPVGGAGTTTVSTYTRGTLVVDIWDARNKVLVWRGTAEAVVETDPERKARQIEQALDAIVEAWDKQQQK